MSPFFNPANKVRNIIVLSVLLLGLGVSYVFFFGAKNFQNILNPAHSFRFEYYDTNISMMEVMRKMFPEGTPKTHVEKILVEQAGASIEKIPRDFEVYSYMYTIPYLIDATWNIVVKYYPDHTVDQIWVNGSAVHRYKPFTPGKIK